MKWSEQERAVSSGKQSTTSEKEGNADVNTLTWGRHKSLIGRRSRQPLNTLEEIERRMKGEDKRRKRELSRHWKKGSLREREHQLCLR